MSGPLAKEREMSEDRSKTMRVDHYNTLTTEELRGVLGDPTLPAYFREVIQAHLRLRGERYDTKKEACMATGEVAIHGAKAQDASRSSVSTVG